MKMTTMEAIKFFFHSLTFKSFRIIWGGVIILTCGFGYLFSLLSSDGNNNSKNYESDIASLLTAQKSLSDSLAKTNTLYSNLLLKVDSFKSKPDTSLIVHHKDSVVKLNSEEKYSISKEKIPRGEVFYDPKTKIAFTVTTIDPNMTANIVTDIPFISKTKAKKAIITGAALGQTWEYTFDKKRYKLILFNLNYVHDYFGIKLIEL